MKEIFEDVLKEEENKKRINWKRIEKSIGFFDWSLDGNYEVNLRQGVTFICETQFKAFTISLLAQINERLKRIEEKIK